MQGMGICVLDEGEQHRTGDDVVSAMIAEGLVVQTG